MNECHLYQELISRLVDGELNKNEYAALKEHLENCSEWSAMYAVFASLSDIIGSEDEPLPEINLGNAEGQTPAAEDGFNTFNQDDFTYEAPKTENTEDSGDAYVAKEDKE